MFDLSRPKAQIKSTGIKWITSPAVLAVGIGLCGGYAALFFHHALSWLRTTLLEGFGGYPFDKPWSPGQLPPILFFLLPTLGGLLVGLLVKYVSPQAEGPGTDGLIQSFHEDDGKVPMRVPLAKGVATLMTLGSGGSAGQEGPLAQIGGGIGSLFGKLTGAGPAMNRTLLLSGTAAGLGAIFQAPLGGALTACEILYREDFESQSFQPAVIASVTGFAVFRIHMPVAHFLELPGHALLSWRELLAAACMGLCMVPLSWLFTRMLAVMGLLFGSLNIPKFLKPALGGALLGIIGYFLPQVIGTGWEVVLNAARGHYGLSLLFLIVGAKLITTSLTLGSGGSGGLFGPSLFLGAVFGAAFGNLGHLWLPSFFPDPLGFSLIGMGAFFAGAAKAPLAGIVMVCEMTGNYAMLPALLISGATHYGLSRAWTIYPSQRETRRHSPAHRQYFQTDPLRGLSVAEAFEWDPHPVTLPEDLPLISLAASPKTQSHDDIPVVDPDGKLKGILKFVRVNEVLDNPLLEQTLLIEDVMDPPISVTLGWDLHSALALLDAQGLSRIPVIDEDGRVLGCLDHAQILRARPSTLKRR